MFVPPVHRGPARLLAVLPAVAALALAAPAQGQVPVPTGALPDPVALVGTAAPAASCAGAGATPGTISPTAARITVLCLLNAQRVAAGLPPLRANRALRLAASRFARAMVVARFFDHISPGGSTLRKRVARTAYLRHAPWWSLGENIAYGSAGLGTPAAIVDAWMQSPPHRANILTREFRDIGIGIAAGMPTRDPGPGATYVTDFGARLAR